MLDTHCGESTLPTLHHVVSGVNPQPQLQCTILFHPQVQRIGEQAILEDNLDQWVLGRYSPGFAAAGVETAGRPLDDPYISRRALQVSLQGNGILLQRPDRASRCRVQDVDLREELQLDEASLARGVPLLLAHSVVLMLRLVDAPATSGAGIEIDTLVGGSRAMCALREQVRRAAASDQDVLVLGETGVGKELVAQAVCAGSRRATGPLVTVNMAAVPSALAAAFLFGNTRGAFSGAERARRGYFREADGGTLFLDEVGDTPEEVQPLLLRALQQREVQVVGGEIETVDVRVISATDAAIDQVECDFKSALRHRLGAIEIKVPPLRDHPEDIGSLLLHGLRLACDAEGCLERLPHEDSPPLQLAHWAGLFLRFASYNWPGNVRQLANFASQVVIASEQSPVIPPNLLAAFLATDTQGTQERKPVNPVRRMKDISEREFDDTMAAHGYEVRPVAEALGVSHQSVYRRIDKSTVYRRVSEVTAQELEAVLAVCAGEVSRCAAQLKVSESALRTRLCAAGSPAGF